MPSMPTHEEKHITVFYYLTFLYFSGQIHSVQFRTLLKRIEHPRNSPEKLTRLFTDGG